MKTQHFTAVTNEELLVQIFTAEDRVKKSAIDEIILRADELVPELKHIVMSRHNWQAQTPEWWAPVHATYILASIGGERVVTALLTALRWADAYDNEWVTEELPAMFGSLGSLAQPQLENILHDVTAGSSARALALESLAAMSLWHPALETQVMPQVVAVFRDRQEAYELRLAAAAILLDFRYRHLRDELLSFAALDSKQLSAHAEMIALTAEDIDRELTQSFRAETYYRHDWLSFYEQDHAPHRLFNEAVLKTLH